MKKHLSKILIAASVICLSVFSLSAWNQNSNTTRKSENDTIPGKKIRDLDDALREIDKATIELNKTDWNKIEKELNDALKKLDVAKMKLDIEKDLREIDMTKLKAEMEKAMKEIDVNKIKADVDAALAKIDMDKIKLEMEKVKEIDFEKIQLELKSIKPTIEKTMAEAKVSIEKAKKEIAEYKSFVDDLEKDGLISKKGEYTIEHKNGELIINNKKQPAEDYNKYRIFLEKNK